MPLTKVNVSVIDIGTVDDALSSVNENSKIRQYVDELHTEQSQTISTVQTDVSTNASKIAAVEQSVANAVKITVSTDLPSGGKNGDVWFRVPQ